MKTLFWILALGILSFCADAQQVPVQFNEGDFLGNAQSLPINIASLLKVQVGGNQFIVQQTPIVLTPINTSSTNSSFTTNLNVGLYNMWFTGVPVQFALMVTNTGSPPLIASHCVVSNVTQWNASNLTAIVQQLFQLRGASIIGTNGVTVSLIGTNLVISSTGGSGTDTNAAHLNTNALQAFAGPISATGNVSATGSGTFNGVSAGGGLFSGNGLLLTGLNASSLATGTVPISVLPTIPFTNGGLGQSLGTNWVPAGAAYDDGSLIGDPAYLITLKAGVEYQVNPNNDPANFQGLTDQTESQIYATGSGGTFTAPTNGSYAMVAGTGPNPVMATVYAVSNIFLPLSPGFGDVVANSLTLNTPLPVGAGGTGVTSLGSLAAVVGSQYNSETTFYPWDSTWTPAYTGQMISQNVGGGTQDTAVYVATGTGAKQSTNSVWFPFGISTIGNPGFMAPNPGRGMDFFLNGNPRDTTNTLSGDITFNFFNMNPYQSGTFITFPVLSTNGALGETGVFPKWYTTGKVTNAAGTVVHFTVTEQSSFGVVGPDCTNQSDLPGTSLWIVNGGAVYGTTNFTAPMVLGLNGAINGLTAGNYSMLRVDPNHGLIGTQLLKDQAWNPKSNNWVWAQVTDYVLGRTTNCNLTVLTNFITPSVIFSSGPTQTTGAGSPNSVVTAPVGSTFYRTDGSSGTTLYVKETGSGNTGWVGK